MLFFRVTIIRHIHSLSYKRTMIKSVYDIDIFHPNLDICQFFSDICRTILFN